MGRCTANPKRLDGQGGPHSHAHTHALLQAFDLNEMWDAYGIVGDLIVSVFMMCHSRRHTYSMS